MSIITNKNTIIKFSKRVWIVPTMVRGAMHKYSSLKLSIEHLGKWKGQEAPELTMLILAICKPMMTEV